MVVAKGIHSHKVFKLGKAPARRDRRNLLFGRVLKRVPPLPREYDFDREHPGMPTPVRQRHLRGLRDRGSGPSNAPLRVPGAGEKAHDHGQGGPRGVLQGNRGRGHGPRRPRFPQALAKARVEGRRGEIQDQGLRRDRSGEEDRDPLKKVADFIGCLVVSEVEKPPEGKIR